MTSRGQEKGLQPYGALDCFGRRCGGEWKATLLFCRNIYTLLVFSPTRPEGGAGKQQAERTAVRAAPIVCPKESPLCFLADYGPKGVQGGERKAPCIASLKDNFAARDSPPVGIDAPTPACGHGLQPYEALYCFGRRSEGVQGASGKPPASSNRQQLCRKQSPMVGPDAPTPARIGTCRPMGRSIASGGDPKGCRGASGKPPALHR